jgi:glycerol-3-phosphate dehydrogenase
MRDLKTIQDKAYDVIIIGGGVNGAAVARDAALRGLRTILLEKSDFASGTSSWSTRLVHGGLRYLEYFEFYLVRESLRERETLLRTAPHLVKPLLLTVPVYGGRSRPYWKIWAGMILYDIFSFDKTLLAHQMLPKRKMKQLFRSLDPERLKGGAQYYDGQAVYAERLCLENIVSAVDAGATALNYTEVTKLHREGNRLTHLSCKDQITGEEFVVKGTEAAVVVNTSGPWVDEVCDRAVDDGDKAKISKGKMMGGTKGSHIIVDAFPGAPDTALYVEAKTDGRPFFIVPWLDMYLIGTTDLRYQDSLDRVKADNEEIDYLLKETNLIIPSANLNRESIRFTYSGVRPLPNEEGKDPGSVTRKHIIHDHTGEGVTNLLSLIGGKLTTFRHVGEEIVDEIYAKLYANQGRSAPSCPTEDLPLPGAIIPNDPQIQAAMQQYGEYLFQGTINYLFEIYGTRAKEVLELVRKNPKLAEPLSPQRLEIKAQVVYSVENEFAYSIADILRRRTTIAMQGEYGYDTLPAVTEVLQSHCGWTQEQCDHSVAEYRRYMEENCIPDYALGEPSEAQARELVNR